MEDNIPRISINQLAAFIGASEKTKYNILKLRKFPKDSKFMSNLYNTPKSAVIQFIQDEKHDLGLFTKKYEELLQKKVSNDWQKNDKQNSLLALKQLEKYSSKYLKNIFSFEAKRCLIKDIKYVMLQGVRVDINPDILLFNKQDDKTIGGIKMYFSKGKKLTPMDGQTIAGLIKNKMEKVLGYEIANDNILVLDVFNSNVINAPDNFDYHKMRLNNACNEIIKIWDKISKEN